MTLDERVLTGAGATPENAGPLAHAIMQAERDGIASHGLMYLPVYAEHLSCGKVDGRAVPTLETPRPGVVRVDTQRARDRLGRVVAKVDVEHGRLTARAPDQRQGMCDRAHWPTTVKTPPGPREFPWLCKTPDLPLALPQPLP